ncbi:chemotaxis protein CheA [Microvirga pudoricolor]|uniref:chemotaxis protein CheA n=1 Tax=Microvirga pudoricolor TaxID=2778729 RepID=UPI00195251FE|nr:chemotaxis protein CheA [Microvirga pudoricolor]MBM6595235.1 chemotaxis protein CheA [Microvirga pudoricolor]
MDDLLHHFIVEAKELIQQASDDLLALERRPFDPHRLDSAFRAVHTLKGSVGLFDLKPLGDLLHAAEDLLAAARADGLDLDAAALGALFACLEASERWVGAVEANGDLPPDAPEKADALAAGVRSLLDTPNPSLAAVASRADAAWADALFDALRGSDPAAAASGRPLTAIRYEPRPDCFFSGDDPLGLMRSVPELAALKVSARDPWPPAGSFDPFACNLVIEALSGAPHPDVAAVFRFVPDQVRFLVRDAEPAPAVASAPSGAQGPDSGPPAGPRTVRVEAGRIDRLADLVGELIVAKNALAHLVDAAGRVGEDVDWTGKLAAHHAVIDRLAGDLHAAVVDVRMLPLRDIFRRFPRTVREIGARLGKTVGLTVSGEDIEADKTVIDALSEPLVHVLRNAIDHGVEPGEVRLEAGKSPEATITLRASRFGNRLSIEVSDDGRGIDPARIRRVAAERAVVAPDRLAAMSDDDILDLVFTPGFSTSGSVTDLSGRGVGMDAVRAAVESLGGRVSVLSRPGHGTTVKMDLPTSVVMTQIMSVEAGGRVHGVLMDSIIETAAIRRDRIAPVGSGRAFVLRNRTVPLVHLSALLDGPERDSLAQDVKVLVVRVGSEPVGVAVDRFIDRMDVMMRPMTGILAGAPGLIGTTIQGDGSVLMVLDIAELIG